MVKQAKFLIIKKKKKRFFGFCNDCKFFSQFFFLILSCANECQFFERCQIITVRQCEDTNTSSRSS